METWMDMAHDTGTNRTMDRPDTYHTTYTPTHTHTPTHTNQPLSKTTKKVLSDLRLNIFGFS